MATKKQDKQKKPNILEWKEKQMRASGQGRKKKPAEIKALEMGTPKPVNTKAVIIDKPPKWLTENKFAKAEYNRLKPWLNSFGIVQEQDLTMFYSMCESYGLWRDCMVFLQENGLTYKQNGLVKKRPECDIARQYKKEYMDLARDFGLTPSARARVDFDTSNNGYIDPMEQILNS